MEDQELSFEDIEYIADMLQAVAWAKDDLLPISAETHRELDTGLALAEAALRKAATELRARCL